MACCARLAPVLLIHVNLLLCLVAGAGLTTAARLKWDPSAYVPARALFPREYRVAAAALTAAGAALLTLAHVAVAALALRPARPRCARALLLLYAASMAAAVCAQAAWVAWTGARLAAWLRSESAAAAVRELAEIDEHLRPLLALLARHHPLPERLKELLEEAREDAPRGLRAGGAALLLALLLQPAAALLALLCAAAPGARAEPCADGTAGADDSVSYSFASADDEKAPLRTAYRAGRLVVL